MTKEAMPGRNTEILKLMLVEVLWLKLSEAIGKDYLVGGRRSLLRDKDGPQQVKKPIVTQTQPE
jgi:hypothetical protein